jgi:hypothetical protein
VAYFGALGDTGDAAIHADMFIPWYAAEVIRDYPRRSVCFNMAKGLIASVALLSDETPGHYLGLLRFSRRNVERVPYHYYSKKLPTKPIKLR